MDSTELGFKLSQEFRNQSSLYIFGDTELAVFYLPFELVF